MKQFRETVKSTRITTPKKCMLSLVIFCLAMVGSTHHLFAEDTGPAVSADLLRIEIDYFAKAIETKCFKDSSKHNETNVKRLVNNASALGELFVAIGLSKEKSDLKASAPKLVELSQELVKSAKDYDAAQKVFKEIQASLSKHVHSDEKLTWGPHFGLEPLMKAVDAANGRLKRAVRSEKSFKRLKGDKKTAAAAHAAFVAIVGHDTLLQTDEIPKDLKDKTEKWTKTSEEMVDSAEALSKAILKGEFAEVEKQNKRLQKSCDACHKDFKEEDDDDD